MTSLHTSRSEWQCWPDSEVDRIDLTAHGQRGSTITFAVAKINHPILQHGSIDLHDSRHRFTTGAVQNQLFDDRSGPPRGGGFRRLPDPARRRTLAGDRRGQSRPGALRPTDLDEKCDRCGMPDGSRSCLCTHGGSSSTAARFCGGEQHAGTDVAETRGQRSNTPRRSAGHLASVHVTVKKRTLLFRRRKRPDTARCWTFRDEARRWQRIFRSPRRHRAASSGAKFFRKASQRGQPPRGTAR